MSSTLVAEQSQGVHVFPTTVGFKATTGFTLSLASSTPSSSLRQAVPKPSQLPQKQPLLVKPSGTSGPLSSAHAANQGPPLAPAPGRHAASPSHENVGWKGLFEISRNSGASGVMGARNALDDEGPAARDGQIEVCATAHTNASIRRLVKSVVRGLKACQEPEKTKEGMGGTYFFANENGRKVAILKPCDEEPLAPNNPKGYVGRSLGDPGWKPTVRVGEAAMREVAAYLLDHEGFAKVPTSVLVRARHPIFCYNNRMSSVRASSLDLGAVGPREGMGMGEPEAESGGAALRGEQPLPMKLGSLQEFVSHECDTSEMGPSRFSVADVHRIGILDIRLFNTDRHAGNMLVRSNKESSANLGSRMANDMRELIPIDHGFCLPETLEAPYFEWLHWPQALQPFSEEELAYIRKLDIEADKELLRKELPNLRPECLRVLELGTTLLKRGAEEGLTLFEIGNVMTRPFGDSDEEPSDLENLCMQAWQTVESEKAVAGSSAGDSSSDEDGSDDVINASEEVEFAIELHAGLGLSPSEGSREHDIIFELEEDAAGNRCIKVRQAQAEVAQAEMACSPSQFSDSSFSSTGGSDIPFTLCSRPVLCDALGGLEMMQQPLPVQPPVTPACRTVVARSVCVTDGFLLRHMKSRRSNALGKAHTKQAGRGKHAISPQAYPPPVLAVAPESRAISFSDMDEADWCSFMGAVNRMLRGALESGKWKKGGRAFDSVAASCPRF